MIATPPIYGGCFTDSSFKNFVPTHQFTSVLVEIFLHILRKPGLQLCHILQIFLFDAFLTIGAVVPAVAVYFISSNMDVFIGEEVKDFFVDIAAEFQGGLFSQAEGVVAVVAA